MARFPVVTGTNLLRQKLSLPAGFKGELNILIIAFHQWHQSLVDTWIPAADQTARNAPPVWYYELPVIQGMNPLSQMFINEGMRAGIPNLATRERTITLYLDKRSFREALEIGDEATIHILLTNRLGDILWRESGAYTPEKGRALLQAIDELLPTLREHTVLATA